MPPRRPKTTQRPAGASRGRAPATEPSWAHSQAIELLNDAKLATDASAKTSALKALTELVLRKDPNGLLAEFLTPLLELQVDPTPAARKYVASLCEEVVVSHPDHIVPCVGAVRALLKDETPVVVKTAAKSGQVIFREALIQAATLGEGPAVPKHVTETWAAARAIKDDVRALVLSDRANDGVRMQAVKFLEKVVLLFHGVDWGASIVAHDHATLSMDELQTEADDLIGVLLECLKPDACAKQSGTVTLVMIGAAANVTTKLPMYAAFVLPALLELAASYAGQTEDAATAASASASKELRGTLLNALKSGAREMEPFRTEIETALTELGAGDAVDAWRRQTERADAKRKEREAAAAARGGGDRDADDRAKRRRAEDGGGDGPHSGGAGDGSYYDARPTDPGLVAQVLSTIASLAYSDRAMLDTFVRQLGPAVLADVVMAQTMENLHLVGGRTMIDVQAGMGRGVEGIIERAAALHAAGVREGAAPGAGGTGRNGPRMGMKTSSDGELIELDDDDDADAAEEEDEEDAAAAARRAAGPFKPRCGPMSDALRRGHVSFALARIVQAADPHGAVSNMGAAGVQCALAARLATSSVAASLASEAAAAAAREEDEEEEEEEEEDAGGAFAVGGRLPEGCGGLLVAPPGGSAHRPPAAAGFIDYLVSSLPDPAAVNAGARLLAAMFVNETMDDMERGDGGGRLAGASKKGINAKTMMGGYARTLMTIAVGLVASDSAARAEHLPKLLVDAPHVPPAATRLLRAMCQLPLPPLPASTANASSKTSSDEGGGGVASVVDALGFEVADKERVVKWGGRKIPRNAETVTLALSALQTIIDRRPTCRASCLEIALECATHADETIRGKAIRVVSGGLHQLPHLAAGIEAYAAHHLGEAAREGAKELDKARALAAKAAASIAADVKKKKDAEDTRLRKAAALKAEAEGRSVEDVEKALKEAKEGKEGKDSEEEAAANAMRAAEEAEARTLRAASAAAIAATSRHLLLFCALCHKKPSLLRPLFQAYADLPPELRPAVVSNASFDGLVRVVGPTSEALVEIIRSPPKGSESLALRAVEVLADVVDAMNRVDEAPALEGGAVPPPPPPKAAPVALVQAAEALSEACGGDIKYVMPLTSSLKKDVVAKSLLPRVVGVDVDAFREVLDRLTATTPAKPLTATEILIALHDVDPVRHGVPLKKIIDACGECFNRPDVFTPEVVAAALQKMVEATPLPLLFMRSVIQAEQAAPSLREFTLGLLRTLTRRQVWKMDGKIWEGFCRCAKRATPRSFPVMIDLPPKALEELLNKFPALREPLRAYASSAAVSPNVPRAIAALLQQEKEKDKPPPP